ncbi:MAG: hypothetical protein LBK08_11025 [Treponema sp.]|nr:hypothetical protein [Treponema sp.]
MPGSQGKYPPVFPGCQGKHCIPCSKRKNNIRLLPDRKINGIILAPAESRTIPEELRNAGIPVVLIDRQYDSHYLLAGINNFQSSCEGTRYLWAKGSKNPGFYSGRESGRTALRKLVNLL